MDQNGLSWSILVLLQLKIAPKMTLFHVGFVSCRVASWAELVDPNVMKD